MTSHTYHAHGKVLLSGEYMILDGAVGCGLPTHHGQTLTIDTVKLSTPIIRRTAQEQGTTRFAGTYDKSSHQRTSTTDEKVSEKLSHLFAFGDYHGVIHHDNHSYNIITDLSYPRHRGLGSSSTLIHLYTQLVNTDPYAIHTHAHPRGSGYDIACAGASGPILFQKTPSDPFHVTPIDRRPSFHNQLYFIYSGTKQDSNESISSYKSRSTPTPDTLDAVTSLTHQMIDASSINTFSQAMRQHESIIADHLQTTPIQQSRFADAPDGFTIKSLGGRGGDFLLIARPGERGVLTDYLATKSISTIFARDEFIL